MQQSLSPSSLRPAILLLALASAPLAAQNVLAYHGNCGGHFDPVPGAMAQFPSGNLTQTTNIATFETMAAMGGWDVIIYDSYSPTITVGALDQLSAQLAAGSGVIFYYWRTTLDGITATHPLFTVDCPITFSGTRSSTQDWNLWDPMHPIATTPNMLSWPLAGTFDTCGIEGQLAEPIMGSTAMAGFSVAPSPNEAGVILSPNNRMIFNAQILGLFSNTVSQDLLANQIAFLSGCRGECDFPYTLSPSAPPGCPGARMTDDTVMVDSTQCMVDQETPSCGAGGEDAFASFTAPFDGMATADTCGMGTTFDTILVAYEGACGALVELACNDDTCGTSSQVTFPVTAGNDYYLLVDGAGGATGTAELRLQLTESPADYVPIPGFEPNSIAAAAPRATAIEVLQLAATGAGGSQVAYLPCYDQYYGFDTSGAAGTYEVFDSTGAQVSSSTMVGVFGRGIALNPLTGQLEVITAGAMSGGGASDGLMQLDLDASAFYDTMSTQLLGSLPGLAGNNTAPALDYARNVWYSREGTDTVNVVDATTGMLNGTITLDSVAAGSPTFLANSIAFTNIFGLELVVPSADAAHVFDLTGSFVQSVPFPTPLSMTGDFCGSFVNDLFWMWDGAASMWRGYEIFDSNFSIPCSSAMPGTDLVLMAGPHTVDTDTGAINGAVSAAFDGTAFNFDNVDIQAGAVVDVRGSQPLIIHALGDITVDGDLNAAGGDGLGGAACNSLGMPGGPGGPGGGAGGSGAPDAGFTTLMGENGMGPGGGMGGEGDNSSGGGGGFAMPGGSATGGGTGPIANPGMGGSAYTFLLPTVVGGSGGGGGSPDDDSPTGVADAGDDGGGGGGGGGGAIVLNAGGALTLNGNIDVSGGAGGANGCGSSGGGGGSGGFVALLDGLGMPTVTGTIDLSGGAGGLGGAAAGSDGGVGSDGRLFMDRSPCGFRCSISGPAAPPTSSLVTVQVDAMTMVASYDATFEFSTDAGATFTVCTAALGPMGGMPVVPNPATGLTPGVPTSFIWNSALDGVSYPATGVLVRATVSDGMSMATCTTAPFDIGCECGDCNEAGDGITIVDALVGAQIAAGVTPPAPGTPGQMLCCDVNGDLSVSILDALQMAQSSAGLFFVPLCP